MNKDDELVRRGDVNETFKGSFVFSPRDHFHQTFEQVVDSIPAAPQEMSAREYLMAKGMVCQNYTHHCGACPICSINNGHQMICSCFEASFPEEAIEIVAKWAAEHPEKKRKTYAEDFFEKYPNAERAIGVNTPWACRTSIYGGNCSFPHDCNAAACRDCWNAEMEDADA